MSEDNTSWRDSLPDDLKDHSSLKDVKDVSGLAKQFVDTLSAQGQMIRVPGPDAGDEAWSNFHNKLTEKVPTLIPTPDPDNPELMKALFKRMGAPEAPTGYEHPEGIDPTQMADFANLAHQLGITKSQYGKIVGAFAEATKKDKEAAADKYATEVRALKQEWGIVYEDNIQLVDAVLKGTGAPPEVMEAAASKTMSPGMQKWLFEVGKQLGTEGINFQKDESTTRLAPSEALARANEIMADREGPYWDGAHPQHKEYVQRVIKLRQAAAAGGLS
jgi:hypothetical protein